MSIQWYPLQLFVRRLELVIPLAVSFLISVGLCVWVIVLARHIKEPVFLHYSIELGVDASGTWHQMLILPIGLVLVSLGFAALANGLVLQARKFAVLVAYASPLIILLGAWCVFLLLRVNGAV